jgi:toxin ParE1/3/4
VTARIHRTPRATIDLDDIWFSIATDSERAADRLVVRIEGAEDRLAEFPEMGPARDDLAAGVRSWTVGEYVIFYGLSPGVVTILRIVHGARDLGDLLSEP